MKKINILIILTLLLSAIITSCQKDETPQPVKSSPIVLNNFTEESSAIEELAITTAKALSNTEFRNQIKNEAMKQFDGDYDILYSRLNSEALKNGAVNGNFYLENLSLVQSAFKTNPKEYISNLIKQVPKFQIAVPVNCENWNADNYTPLVAYIPVNFDEKTFTKIKAFDSRGNLHWLPLDKDPDVPVIVLGYNERTDDEGNLLDSNNSFKNYPIDTDDGGGGFSYISNKLYLIKLKIKDLSDYEAWCLGKPEIYIDIHSDESQYSLGQLYSHPKRSDVENRWKTYNHKFCSWPTDIDRLYAKCYEKDNNITVTIGFTISAGFKLGENVKFSLGPGFSIKTIFQGGDDDMGTYMILKSDAEKGLYSNSNLSLYFKH
jgi:hypothetical protein